MWEKISKEMQLPWRAAEAMHWQIGEVEMAQRANVPVFHLAGQQGSGSESRMGSIAEGRSGSTSPSMATGMPPNVAYSHTHKHSLPTIPQHMTQPISPLQTRLRRNSSDASPNGPSPLRRRADSVHTPRAFLPPVSDLAPPHPHAASQQARFTLPPVVTSSTSDPAGRR